MSTRRCTCDLDHQQQFRLSLSSARSTTLELLAFATMWFSEQPTSDERVYRRPLPSGGYVAIATQPVKRLFARASIRGHVVVERRSEERRVGHPPPIVAIAEYEDVEAILAVLVPIAESDAILSQALAQRVTVPITQRRTLPEG